MYEEAFHDFQTRSALTQEQQSWVCSWLAVMDSDCVEKCVKLCVPTGQHNRSSVTHALVAFTTIIHDAHVLYCTNSMREGHIFLTHFCRPDRPSESTVRVMTFHEVLHTCRGLYPSVVVIESVANDSQVSDVLCLFHALHVPIVHVERTKKNLCENIKYET